MIILVNGGGRSPSQRELNEMAAACGTKDWQVISLAAGDLELTPLEKQVLGERLLDVVSLAQKLLVEQRQYLHKERLGES